MKWFVGTMTVRFSLTSGVLEGFLLWSGREDIAVPQRVHEGGRKIQHTM